MEKIWLKHYPAGVPATINYSQYASLADMIEKFLKKWRDRPAFTNMGKSYSYAEIDKLSRDFGAYLTQTLGLKKGDVIAMMMPNCIQYPICLYGAIRAGLIVANVNPLYTPRELEHQLKDCGAKAIVIVANFASTLEKVIAKTAVKHVIVSELGDLLGFPKRLIVNFVVKSVKKMVPAFHLPQAVLLLRALSQGATKPFSAPDIKMKDTVFLQYTGGTTGVSKGAILTHENMVANICQASAWLESAIDSENRQSVIMTPLPLYHIFSLMANLLTYCNFGGHNILITNPRDIPAFVKEFEKYKPDAITAVNTLFNALLNNKNFCALDFSGLRLALGGGMAVQRAVAEKWQKVTGQVLIEAYGLTETSPAVCVNPLDRKEFNGTVGLPLSSTDVELRGEDGKAVPLGEPGEICVKGPQVMKGYWNRPDETEKVLKDGWLHTGDIAVMTPEGFVKIVDRAKDMILVSGFNVYPNEIEEVAVMHPGVLEAAAVGVPSADSGERVKLFVVKKDQALTEQALLEHCRKQLTGYKIPKEIEFRTELPKSNVGKILRRPLRDEAREKAKDGGGKSPA